VQLEGSIVMVTGAAGGIGGAVVEALEANGARVAALDARRVSRGSLMLVADATDDQEIGDAVGRVERELGAIDGLVCATGTVREHAVPDITTDEWHDVVDSALLATFLACRAVVPGMQARKRGRIVAFSSGYATKGYARGAHYAAGKAGVEALVKSLALEVADAGITVNAVAPGPIETAMLDPLVERPGWRDAMEAAIPLGRVGQPVDVVEPVLFLLDDRASYITGQVLHVNGGLLMP
jgi:NAD(P)-dependent dehydrogenase (short-subunit alcohol dehydrogenase family)